MSSRSRLVALLWFVLFAGPLVAEERIIRAPPNESKRFPALNFDPEKAPDYSPIVHVTSDDPPTLLIHGDKDRLVPLRNSQNILTKLQDEKIATRLLVLEGAEHGFRGEHRQKASRAMVAWFAEHLAAK